jgi:hypothetical protein
MQARWRIEQIDPPHKIQFEVLARPGGSNDETI